MEQVRLCAVWPTENWLGSSLNQIQGWTTVRESYSRALEQRPLIPLPPRYYVMRRCEEVHFLARHDKQITFERLIPRHYSP